MRPSIVDDLAMPCVASADDWRTERETSARDDIKQIKADLARHRRWRRHGQVVLFVAVLCAGALSTVAGWRYFLGHSATAILLRGFAGVAVLTAIVSAVFVAALVRRQRESELELSTERDVLALIWSVERRDTWRPRLRRSPYWSEEPLS